MFTRTLKYVKPNNGIVPVEFKYNGGPYIDVYFGSYMPKCLAVINVWDFSKGESNVTNRDEFNKTVVAWWRAEQPEIRDCIAQLR